ncbi:MAG: hypothetical protein ACIAQZ_01160 [Sedimentisphaeraceae bacterium JB056]
MATIRLVYFEDLGDSVCLCSVCYQQFVYPIVNMLLASSPELF